MNNQDLPVRLTPTGNSLTFSESTIPDALKCDHKLAPGRWGVLRVLEGTLRFIDPSREVDSSLSASEQIVIHPDSPHRVVATDKVLFRIDFFREPEENS